MKGLLEMLRSITSYNLDIIIGNLVQTYSITNLCPYVILHNVATLGSSSIIIDVFNIENNIVIDSSINLMQI